MSTAQNSGETAASAAFTEVHSKNAPASCSACVDLARSHRLPGLLEHD